MSNILLIGPNNIFMNLSIFIVFFISIATDEEAIARD